jgi:hypothetical protein
LTFITGAKEVNLSTIQGLPAHILLVHVIVVLIPLTAVLASLGAVWPAARRRLIWLIAVLAAGLAVLTPVTTEAGEWLEHRLNSTDLLRTHTSLGDTMPYFSVALLIGVGLLVTVHVRDQRGRPLPTVVAVVFAVVTLTVSAAAIVQVYRVGDSGSRSAWSGEVAAADSGS